PVVGALEEQVHRPRDVDFIGGIWRAGFEQQHVHRRGLGQPGREHAPCAACADDDVVIHGHSRPNPYLRANPTPSYALRNRWRESSQTRSRLGRPRARLGTIGSTRRAPETAGKLHAMALRITPGVIRRMITLRSPRMPYRARFVNTKAAPVRQPRCATRYGGLMPKGRPHT